MSKQAAINPRSSLPDPASVLELLKPITWFAPMWALGCGVVSAGVPLDGKYWQIAGSILLAGPLVCATSQAVNDWYDRHVDAINEPDRPIPSGRIPGQWGLIIAIIWTCLSLFVAALLGKWVFGAAVLGLVLAWAYSAPPFRLKKNGWWGNAAVGFCYEGVPWFTGAAALMVAMPDWRIITLAALYSIGAHGIMTLNDFKSIEGDRELGLRSLPARYGMHNAARLACVVMALPQVAVIWLLMSWGQGYHALAVLALLGAQGVLMWRLLKDPKGKAAWYNATGTTLYVVGMLIAAFAVRGLAGGVS